MFIPWMPLPIICLLRCWWMLTIRWGRGFWLLLIGLSSIRIRMRGWVRWFGWIRPLRRSRRRCWRGLIAVGRSYMRYLGIAAKASSILYIRLFINIMLKSIQNFIRLIQSTIIITLIPIIYANNFSLIKTILHPWNT